MTVHNELEKLREQAKETVEFLSNKRKKERERSICQALLKALGVRFGINEIRSSESDPPDVFYCSARFEVFQAFDGKREIHNDWKEEHVRRKEALNLESLIVPYNPPDSIQWDSAVELIIPTLVQKQKKYGKEACRQLDIIAYLTLKSSFIDVSTPQLDLSQLGDQGWRSVSLISDTVARVLYTNVDAPEFLRSVSSQIFACNSSGGFFNS